MGGRKGHIQNLRAGKAPAFCTGNYWNCTIKMAATWALLGQRGVRRRSLLEGQTPQKG